MCSVNNEIWLYLCHRSHLQFTFLIYKLNLTVNFHLCSEISADWSHGEEMKNEWVSVWSLRCVVGMERYSEIYRVESGGYRKCGACILNERTFRTSWMKTRSKQVIDTQMDRVEINHPKNKADKENSVLWKVICSIKCYFNLIQFMKFSSLCATLRISDRYQKIKTFTITTFCD